MKELLRRLRSFEDAVKELPVTLDSWQISTQH
jgi:hypothetical protein